MIRMHTCACQMNDGRPEVRIEIDFFEFLFRRLDQLELGDLAGLRHG